MNPTRGVEKFSEESRERFLSSDELQRLGATLREAETAGSLGEWMKASRPRNTLPRPSAAARC